MKRVRLTAQFTVVLIAAIASHPVQGAEDVPFRFHAPFAVAVNSQDVVYVAELDSQRVSKFTADGDWLGVIDHVEGYGPLVGPLGVATGPNDWIYIADTMNHKVLILNEKEELQRVLGTGSKGMAEDSFSEPHFLTLDNEGYLYVSDTFNARIKKYTADGKYLKSWGKVGIGPGEFLFAGYLSKVTCDNQGFVYVREFDGGRIQKYTDEGEYVATLTERGVEPGQLDEGYGLTYIDGVLWCPDTFESKVQKLSPEDGKFLGMFDPGEGNGGPFFNHPVDIAQTSQGNLIVTDWKTNRVLKLSPAGEFLTIWGEVDEAELLLYDPPAVEPRPAHKRIKFSVYGSITDYNLESAAKAGVERIYPSFNNRDGDWGVAEQVKKAASMGIEVHPSIAMLVFGCDTKTYRAAHPELWMWKKDAKAPMATALSWAQPESRHYRADHVVGEIVKSQVPGMMLDYIRYYGTDYGYDPIAVNDFFNEYGVNPLSLPQDDPRWMQFRANYVTDFIVELRQKLAIADKRPVEISVFGSGSDGSPEKSMTSALQDWQTWALMGIIDKINVAPYTRDFSKIYEVIHNAKQAVPDRTKVNIFIACYGGNLNTPGLLRKGVEVCVAAGADEITLYRGDAIEELNMWGPYGEIIADTNRGYPESD